jgi:CelD/BcsL family acetyltransferase involved in cellulose biosynthesis
VTYPSVDQIQGLAALEALRPEWEALWRRCAATPFQHPAWLMPWARTHAQDRAAAILVRRDDSLVGLLPVFTWDGALHLAGAGPSDYAAELFAPEAPGAASAALAAAADLARVEGCAIINLPQLRPGSPLLAAPAPPSWSARTDPGDICPVAPLLGPEGLDAVPKLWRKKLAYAHRKVAREGPYAVETAVPETLDEIWSALEAAHAARWQARGEAGGVLADDLLLRFLREAVPEVQAAGRLRLHALRLKGRVVAGLLALHDGPRVHGYLTGFDPALGNLGLGSILIAHTMTAAHAEGAREMHFLRGQEPYKYTWGAEDTPTFLRKLARAHD